MESKSSLTLHRQDITTINAQKHSRDIGKISHVTFGFNCKFTKQRVLFIIYSAILLPELPPFPILESTPERIRCCLRPVKAHAQICVPKMNEGLTGLERHEGELIFWVN